MNQSSAPTSVKVAVDMTSFSERQDLGSFTPLLRKRTLTRHMPMTLVSNEHGRGPVDSIYDQPNACFPRSLISARCFVAHLWMGLRRGNLPNPAKAAHFVRMNKGSSEQLGVSALAQILSYLRKWSVTLHNA